MTRVDTGLGPVAIRPYGRRLSHSQVATLHPDNPWSCPRQWAYGSLMRMQRHPSASACVGRMIDEAATAYWLATAEGKDFVSAVMDAESAAYAEARRCEWPSGDNADREKAAIDAVGPLCAFLKGQCQPPITLALQLNHEFTVRANDGGLIAVGGRSDWVEPGVVVVDLKSTGTRKWSEKNVPDEDWLRRCREQVTVYRLALAATGLPDGTDVPVEGPGAVVAACVSPRRKEPVFARFDFDVTKGDAERMIARIVEADEIARQDSHPPRPGDACSWCAFVERCRSDLTRLTVTDDAVAGRQS